jgi:hypothetical protein
LLHISNYLRGQIIGVVLFDSYCLNCIQHWYFVKATKQNGCKKIKTHKTMTCHGDFCLRELWIRKKACPLILNEVTRALGGGGGIFPLIEWNWTKSFRLRSSLCRRRLRVLCRGGGGFKIKGIETKNVHLTPLNCKVTHQDERDSPVNKDWLEMAPRRGGH